jgi:hypothetical protein
MLGGTVIILNNKYTSYTFTQNTVNCIAMFIILWIDLVLLVEVDLINYF